jgi:hypothetical protein
MLGHTCLTGCQVSGDVVFVQLQQSRSDPDTSVHHAELDCASLHVSRNFMKKDLMLHEAFALTYQFVYVLCFYVFMDVVESGFFNI